MITALAPVVTGDHVPGTTEPWMWALAVVGAVITVALGAASMSHADVGTDDGETREETVSRRWTVAVTGALAVAGFIAFSAGMTHLFHNRGSDAREFHPGAVSAAISERYAIESIAGLDDGGALTAESIEGYCRPVSPTSPELTGVADGQQISFKVGIPDCHEPVAEIIVTETPGQAISAEDLERERP